ncbi:MAG TPA: tRNA pseudouridine(55) synthase TruB [Pyrinomonadaceae bacterium]
MQETFSTSGAKISSGPIANPIYNVSVDGVLIIDKPPDLTSHDVVGRVRRILRERRIGHTGTLDPFATGVLIVLVGRATRLAQFLGDLEKEYEAIIRLGYATNTGDRTGTPLPDKSVLTSKRFNWNERQIQAALSVLTGEIEQVPPMYSAKKQRGQRLYELARRGETVERAPVRVCVHKFEAINPGARMIKDNGDGTYDLATRVVCSTGTYVRSLAEDLGKRLGIGAHLAELRRTRVGRFDLTNAVTLDELQLSFADDALGTVLLTPSLALSQLPFMHLTDEDERKARHGREVDVEGIGWADGTHVRMCDAQGELIAVGNFDADRKNLHPRVVLADSR